VQERYSFTDVARVHPGTRASPGLSRSLLATAQQDTMDATELLTLNEWLFAQESVAPLLVMLARHASSICGSELAFVVLERDGRLEIDATLQRQHERVTRADVEGASRTALRALDQMRPVLDTDPANGSSLLCAPFAVDATTRGVLVLSRPRSAAPLDSNAAARLAELTPHFGVAVRQTARLEELKRRCEELAQPGGAPANERPVRPIDELEREAILHALATTDNDKRRAAQLLGISRAKVYQRLKIWGMT
jgi:transcriptional regulator with GAF, ATPase, and Fis domain